MEAHFVINYHHKFQVSTILYSVFYIISSNPFFFWITSRNILSAFYFEQRRANLAVYF